MFLGISKRGKRTALSFHLQPGFASKKLKLYNSNLPTTLLTSKTKNCQCENCFNRRRNLIKSNNRIDFEKSSSILFLTDQKKPFSQILFSIGRKNFYSNSLINKQKWRLISTEMSTTPFIVTKCHVS